MQTAVYLDASDYALESKTIQAIRDGLKSTNAAKRDKAIKVYEDLKACNWSYYITSDSAKKTHKISPNMLNALHAAYNQAKSGPAASASETSKGQQNAASAAKGLDAQTLDRLFKEAVGELRGKIYNSCRLMDKECERILSSKVSKICHHSGVFVGTLKGPSPEDELLHELKDKDYAIAQANIMARVCIAETYSYKPTDYIRSSFVPVYAISDKDGRNVKFTFTKPDKSIFKHVYGVSDESRDRLNEEKLVYQLMSRAFSSAAGKYPLRSSYEYEDAYDKAFDVINSAVNRIVKAHKFKYYQSDKFEFSMFDPRYSGEIDKNVRVVFKWELKYMNKTLVSGVSSASWIRDAKTDKCEAIVSG